jgi:Subunit ChlI of Mg-chelatase
LLTINLSPATLPKAGSHYDIAIVAAVLAAQGVFGAEQLRRTALLGKSVWTVASVRYAACCLRLWRLNRQVSRG